jgi:hypothetical protein
LKRLKPRSAPVARKWFTPAPERSCYSGLARTNGQEKNQIDH